MSDLPSDPRIMEKALQTIILSPANLSFRFDGEIKGYTEKEKLKKFSSTEPALQEMLKELF